jgi:hypothetical protein
VRMAVRGVGVLMVVHKGFRRFIIYPAVCGEWPERLA